MMKEGNGETLFTRSVLARNGTKFASNYPQSKQHQIVSRGLLCSAGQVGELKNEGQVLKGYGETLFTRRCQARNGTKRYSIRGHVIISQEKVTRSFIHYGMSLDSLPYQYN